MGYYSAFKITLQDESFADAFRLALSEIEAPSYPSDGYETALEPGYDGETWRVSDAKWYEFDSNMQAIAEWLSQISFNTEWLGEDGEGERRYYRNGVVTQKQKRGWVSV